MQQFIVNKARPRTAPVMVVCEGCDTPHSIRVDEAYAIRVPDGKGFAPYDPRPKTPTGGRLGAPGNKMRRFIRTVKVFGCVSASLKYPVVERPRDAAFAERCKKR